MQGGRVGWVSEAQGGTKGRVDYARAQLSEPAEGGNRKYAGVGRMKGIVKGGPLDSF